MLFPQGWETREEATCAETSMATGAELTMSAVCVPSQRRSHNTCEEDCHNVWADVGLAAALLWWLSGSKFNMHVKRTERDSNPGSQDRK